MTDREVQETQSFVDPDPFAIASLFISAATLVLEFIKFRTNEPHKPSSVSEVFVVNLDEALTSSIDSLDRALKAIERGVDGVDENFYDRPLRIGARMDIDDAYYDRYSRNLSEAFASVGGLSLSVHAILQHVPSYGEIIGRGQQKQLGDSVYRLNEIIANGETIRDAISESRLVLSVSKQIVGQILGRKLGN